MVTILCSTVVYLSIRHNYSLYLHTENKYLRTYNYIHYSYVHKATFMQSSYRPHTPGYDYYDAGIYHITLVTRNREPLFGALNMSAQQPAVILNEVGHAVMECWHKIPDHHAAKGRQIGLLAACCMPDHFHGVIEVKERMDVSVGEVICGFKIGCTQAWRQLTGQQPCTAANLACNSGDGSVKEPYMAPVVKAPHNMSHKQRAAYYATRPREEQPLFEDNYDDTICMSHGQQEAMINYVNDNPRRAIIRKLHPDFMARRLHVIINGHDYAAFGNLFLLRWANKEQVFCHRMARLSMLNDEERTKDPILQHTSIIDESRCITKVPFVNTEAFRRQHDQWIAHVMEGATVLVTPGISAGERQMKEECLQHGYPLILLQKEPITRYWKPEKVRFDACSQGSLLILAPWNIDEMGDVNHVPSNTDYARYHNLNTLASEICAFYGEAKVLKDSFQ